MPPNWNRDGIQGAMMARHCCGPGNTWVGFWGWRFSGQIFCKKTLALLALGGGPSSFSGHSEYSHRLRTENLLRSIKKNHRFFLKTKKVRDMFRFFWDKKIRNFRFFQRKISLTVFVFKKNRWFFYRSRKHFAAVRIHVARTSRKWTRKG